MHIWFPSKPFAQFFFSLVTLPHDGADIAPSTPILAAADAHEASKLFLCLLPKPADAIERFVPVALVIVFLGIPALIAGPGCVAEP